MKVDFLQIKGLTKKAAGECPTCKTLLTATSCMTGADLPTPGDLVVCLHCGEILIFDEQVQARLLTRSERRIAQRWEVWPDYLELQRRFRAALATAVFFDDDDGKPS